MKLFFISKQYHQTSTRGFTLIEIMVSMAIFAVVAVIAVGAFLKIIDANKQSQSLQTAMNNTNFALESMVRELRVGTKFYCYNASDPAALNIGGSVLSSNTCVFPGPDGAGSTGYNGIAFISSMKNTANTCNLVHAYQFSNDHGVATLEKAEQPAGSLAFGAASASCDHSLVLGDFVPLVSSDLNIQSFSIQVDCGVGLTCPNGQPKAFLLLKAFAGPTERERTYFTVQTTASERTMRNP